TFVGYRYQQMSQMLRGQSYDVCSQAISGSLNALQSDLQGLRVNYQSRYLVIGTAPNAASIQVTRNPGGHTEGAQIIPNDPVNGWTYLRLQTNPVATIEYVDPSDPTHPVPISTASGYIIELRGNSILHGNDSASVNFTPA